ncbi:MAG TPA: hypothetical protein VMV69_24680 [Pirellulales bacterium]|nr:hypothetical protein [Pirellulales bacterium]
MPFSADKTAPEADPTDPKTTHRKAGKSTRKPAGDMPLAGDHLEGIIATIRRLLPEADQAELVRRLGEPQPDVGLAAIVGAWPRLPAGARSGLVAAAEAFAKAAGPKDRVRRGRDGKWAEVGRPN